MEASLKHDDADPTEEVAIKLSLPELLSDASQTEHIVQAGRQEENANQNKADTFMNQVTNCRIELEDDFRKFEESLNSQADTTNFDAMNWDNLEQRYEDDMKAQIAEEQQVTDDFNAHIKQFMLWMQVSNEKEAERALKRLRTRVAFVQNSENQLSDKQQHYEKVLEAFQNAMKLLGNL